jgi:hypothetical protein
VTDVAAGINPDTTGVADYADQQIDRSGPLMQRCDATIRFVRVGP